MKLAFVDESSDTKFTDYFGVCVAIMDSAYYSALRDGFHKILRAKGWDESIEFKGAYLFSAKSGDTSIPVEERVQIAADVLSLCTAQKNSRVSFHFVHGEATSAAAPAAYTAAISKALNKGLTKPGGRDAGDKRLLYLSCDERSDVSSKTIADGISATLEKRGYSLLESPVIARSNFETVGVLYADIVAYLAARIATISNDVELFEGLSEEDLERNGKVRKLRTSTDLVDRVKNIQWHDHDASLI